MKVHMVCPAPRGSRKGNRVTAERWKTYLVDLGHQVHIADDWRGEPCDIMLALHAKKSYPAMRRYRQQGPKAPLILALTGTDLYRDLRRSKQAQQALRWADRLIGLHDAVAEDLPSDVRSKVRVVLQSITPVRPRPARSRTTFDICVLGHLRREKDPLRTAMALRRLPELPQVRVRHAGAALSPLYHAWACAAMRRDRRYRWLGEISRGRALRLLASSHLMVISSRLEGGANVVSEALVNRVPILASRMPGNVGLLGVDYPGYFEVGDTDKLAELIEKTCLDFQYYEALLQGVARLEPRFAPRHERARLAELLSELLAMNPRVTVGRSSRPAVSAE
jgi:putative glycosyltransferase (TIGR04348 family)